MKEQFPKAGKDQLETLGFDTFTEIQSKSSPLSMKEKMSLGSVLPVLVRHLLPLSKLAQTQTEEGPTTLDFGS